MQTILAFCPFLTQVVWFHKTDLWGALQAGSERGRVLSREMVFLLTLVELESGKECVKASEPVGRGLSPQGLNHYLQAIASKSKAASHRVENGN